MTSPESEPFERAECRSCHQPVFWAYSGTGKPMMVNYEPDEDGNLDIHVRDGRPHFSLADPDSVPLLDMGVRRYVTHFATCVHAEFWQKDSKGRLVPPTIG